jgi:hypothetical protein
MFKSKCPVCESQLQISSYQCPECGTGVSGSFPPRTFDVLGEAEEDFVITFLVCSGNIKQVEKRLGISYPTVKSRLRRIVELLGAQVEVLETEVRIEGDEEVLNELSSGKIDAQEAIRRLRNEQSGRDSNEE